MDILNIIGYSALILNIIYIVLDLKHSEFKNYFKLISLVLLSTYLYFNSAYSGSFIIIFNLIILFFLMLKIIKFETITGIPIFVLTLIFLVFGYQLYLIEGTKFVLPFLAFLSMIFLRKKLYISIILWLSYAFSLNLIPFIIYEIIELTYYNYLKIFKKK